MAGFGGSVQKAPFPKGTPQYNKWWELYQAGKVDINNKPIKQNKPKNNTTTPTPIDTGTPYIPPPTQTPVVVPPDPMKEIATKIGDMVTNGGLNPGNSTKPLDDFKVTLDQIFGAGGAGGNLQDTLNKLIGSATGGTINEYNTAANRLRERTDSATQAQQGQFRDQRLGQGFGGSGYIQKGLQSIGMQGVGQYAQGLSSLSNDFETQRQQGLQTASGVGKSLTDLLGTQVNTGAGLATTAANINSNDFLGKLSSLSNILAGIFNRSGT